MLHSPHRLTALTIAASLLSVAGFVCGNLRSASASLPLLLTSFVCVTIGMLGMYWSAYVLREDVRNERWSEETLAPFRGVLNHVIWKMGLGLLLVAMLAALILERHHRTWFWVVFLLLQTQTQLTTAFARPRKPPSASIRPDWSQISPLHSEHWGER